MSASPNDFEKVGHKLISQPIKGTRKEGIVFQKIII